MNAYRFLKVVLSLALVLGVAGLTYPAYAGEKCAEKCNCSAENCNCKAAGASCSSGEAAQTAKCAEKCGCPEGKCQCGDKEGTCQKEKYGSQSKEKGCGAGKACSNKDGQSASLDKVHRGATLSKATFEGSWSHGAQSSHVN